MVCPLLGRLVVWFLTVKSTYQSALELNFTYLVYMLKPHIFHCHGGIAKIYACWQKHCPPHPYVLNTMEYFPFGVNRRVVFTSFYSSQIPFWLILSRLWRLTKTKCEKTLKLSEIKAGSRQIKAIFFGFGFSLVRFVNTRSLCLCQATVCEVFAVCCFSLSFLKNATHIVTETNNS